jgi:hypothetical protein
MDKLNSEIEEYNAKIQDVNSNMATKITSYLREKNPEFRKLHTVYQNAENAKTKIEKYLRLIDDAIDKVIDAGRMEGIDMFSNNKGISVVSYFSTDSALKAIKEVNKYSKVVLDAIKSYNSEISTLSKVSDDAQVRNIGDLALDFATNGPDFLSVLNMLQLREAEGQLKELKRQISKVDEAISTEYSKLDSQVNQYISKVKADIISS